MTIEELRLYESYIRDIDDDDDDDGGGEQSMKHPLDKVDDRDFPFYVRFHIFTKSVGDFKNIPNCIQECTEEIVEFIDMLPFITDYSLTASCSADANNYPFEYIKSEQGGTSVNALTSDKITF